MISSEQFKIRNNHDQKDRNDIPDRFSYRASSRYFNKRIKTSIVMLWEFTNVATEFENFWVCLIDIWAHFELFSWKGLNRMQ